MNISRVISYTSLGLALASVVIPELGFAGQTEVSQGIKKIAEEAKSTTGDLVDLGILGLGALVAVGGGSIMHSKTGGVVAGGGVAIGATTIREWLFAGTAAGGASIDALLRMVGL